MPKNKHYGEYQPSLTLPPSLSLLSSSPLSGRFSVTTDLGWRTLLSTALSGPWHSFQPTPQRRAEHPSAFLYPSIKATPCHLSAIHPRKGPKDPQKTSMLLPHSWSLLSGTTLLFHTWTLTEAYSPTEHAKWQIKITFHYQGETALNSRTVLNETSHLHAVIFLSLYLFFTLQPVSATFIRYHQSELQHISVVLPVQPANKTQLGLKLDLISDLKPETKTNKQKTLTTFTMQLIKPVWQSLRKS